MSTIAFALTSVVCFWLMQRVPFAPFSVLSDPMQLLWTPLYLLLIATPFFWAGIMAIIRMIPDFIFRRMSL